MQSQTFAPPSHIARRSFLQLSALSAGALSGMSATALAAPSARLPKYEAEAIQSATAANGTQSTGGYSFSIGKIKAMGFNDGFGAMPIQPTFAPEATPEELKTVLTANYHSLDTASMQFNVLLLKIGSENVLIDTGNGASGANPSGLIANMNAAGIKQESITAIYISHGHPDHLFGLVGEKDAPAFPNARIFINKTEHEYWMTSNINFGDVAVPEEWKKAWSVRMPAILNSLKSKLELVNEGDKTFDGIELINTPGHTPGHMSILIRDGSDSLMAMGDLAHNRVIMLARPDWTIGFDFDRKQAVATRRKLFDRIANDRLRVFAYHLPWPGLGNINRVGSDSFHWLIEPWAW